VTILAHIGNTPLVRLRRVLDNPDVEIYVKCEYLNPSGSIKDRMALRMVEEAERRGDLKAGGTILDQSTGNTGPALAFVGAVKGYKVRLVMPAQLGSSYNPESRIRIAERFGCEVQAVDLSEVLAETEGLSAVERGAALVAQRMKYCYEMEQNEPGVWWANQLCNMDNARANRDTTGAEIIEGLEGKVDAWVASIGSGGTLLGVAETLQAVNPSLRIAGVVPADDPRLDWVGSGVVHDRLEKLGMPRPRFIIEEILERELLERTFVVENANARRMADRLAREEGLFCGMSSGANVHAAVQMAKNLPQGARVATVLVDHRDRYFAEHPHEHYVV
jgi:cysteine synthase A